MISLPVGLLVVFKISCFILTFFWFRVPRKCLGFFFHFMVTLLLHVCRMGCLFPKPKKYDNENDSKHWKQTGSLSGRVSETSYDQPAPSTLSVGRLVQYTKFPTTNAEYSTGSTTISSGPENSRVESANLYQNTGDYQMRSKTNPQEIRPVGSNWNGNRTVVSQVNEYSKPNFQKSVRYSLPAQPLVKTPVKTEKFHSGCSSSYDSSSFRNDPHLDDRNRGYAQDPYDRNSYNFWNRNKPKSSSLLFSEGNKKPSSPEMNVYSKSPLLVSMEDKSVHTPAIQSKYQNVSEAMYDDTSKINKAMETQSLLKRFTPSESTQTGDSLRGEENRDEEAPTTKHLKLTTPKRPSVEEILRQFEASLRRKYAENLQAPSKVHNFHFEVFTLEDSGRVERKFCTLGELFPKTLHWKMLIYGKPLFGKSQLCRDITSIWLSSSENDRNNYTGIRQFQILIHHIFSKESFFDFESYFIDKCCSILSDNFITKDELKYAWNCAKLHTLFLLDGYDKLSYSEREKLSFSLRQDFFNDASILLLCRQSVDTELSSYFKIHVDICGLNAPMLYEITKDKSQCSNYLEESKVKELYGISPFYTEAIVSIFTQSQKPRSLYDLLNYVMISVTKSLNVDEITLDIIGMYFLEHLKDRKFVFEKEMLKDLTHKSWNELQKLCLFIPCPSKNKGTRKLIVSHKLFMVYFCVRYLRKEWCRQKVSAQRNIFLKGKLCHEDSSGVYIGTTEPSSNVYFVGLIPEIIFDDENNLFQMIQDVPELNLNLAFKTQSLLVRVDPKRLHRFGITEIKNPTFENSFVSLLNMLDFWGLTIQSSFFVDNNSPLCYLKVLAINEDTRKLVMTCVASMTLSNNHIEEIFLDFLELDIETLFLFLQKFEKGFFDTSQLQNGMCGSELLFSLVTSAIACCRNLYTRLTLGSNSSNLSTLVTWEIISSHCGESCSSFVYTNENETFVKKYNSKECQHLQSEPNCSRVIERMKRSVSELTNPRITVCVQTKC